jgi:hypothetical protein
MFQIQGRDNNEYIYGASPYQVYSVTRDTGAYTNGFKTRGIGIEICPGRN